MSEFTASNGVKVEMTKEPDIEVWLSVAGDYLYESDSPYLTAIREFFQHKRDEELGRWRWPENPEYVVYPDRGQDFRTQPAVIVVQEPTGLNLYAAPDREDGLDGLTYEVAGSAVAHCDLMLDAARAYFAAHPEPKPWHDAKPGEVWVLTLRGEEYGAVREFGNDFKLSNGNLLWLKHEGITAGRRIYPESAS